MTAEKPRGGEADAVRLLELARREVLESLVPALDGDVRYRARLVANALKIAVAALREQAREAAGEPVAARDLEAFTAGKLAGEGLNAAIRAGRFDGDPALYGLLVRLAAARHAGLG